MPDNFFPPPPAKPEEYEEARRYRIITRIDEHGLRVVYQPQKWYTEFFPGMSHPTEWWKDVGKGCLTIEDARLMCETDANRGKPVAEFTIKVKRGPKDA